MDSGARPFRRFRAPLPKKVDPGAIQRKGSSILRIGRWVSLTNPGGGIPPPPLHPVVPVADAFGAVAFVIPVGFLSCHDLELAIFCLAAWVGMTGFGRAGAVVSLTEVVPR